MKRCVIIGGAPIDNLRFVRSLLKEDDFAVFCDSGLYHVEKLGLAPGLIVGDFDSHPRPDSGAEIIGLPREKDDTDTCFAAKEALRRGYRDFLLLGASGGRMDHTLANLSLLLMLSEEGGRASLADDYSLMEVISGGCTVIEGNCAYFSLLALWGPAKGVTIQNAKYPLHDAAISPEYAYAVSNEVLPGQAASISVREGKLLLIRVFQEPGLPNRY